MASTSSSFKAEYKKPIMCMSKACREKTGNVGPYKFTPGGTKGTAIVHCKCKECGGKKARAISVKKEYEGGFLNVLLPLAAAAIPTLLNKLFG